MKVMQQETYKTVLPIIVVDLFILPLYFLHYTIIINSYLFSIHLDILFVFLLALSTD